MSETFISDARSMGERRPGDDPSTGGAPADEMRTEPGAFLWP